MERKRERRTRPGAAAFCLRQKLPLGIVNDDLRIFTRLAELSRKLRGLDDRALRDFLAGWITHDHMRAGIIAGVHPKIIRLSHAKGEIVIIARGTSDENFITVR